ncbi:MAG: hypothetical protein WHX52_06120 [Anaerolineae bacterium]
MNTPSAPMRCLLDKNVVRYLLTGLYYGRLRSLTPLETSALSLWRAAEERGVTLFVSRYTFNVLQCLQPYPLAQIVLNAMPALSPTRYHARWARRIRESTGLSREDAAMIALGSFGSNEAGDILGVHWLATSDQPLLNGYRATLPTLKRRFRAMTAQLSAPFCNAALPHLISPDDLLMSWQM